MRGGRVKTAFELLVRAFAGIKIVTVQGKIETLAVQNRILQAPIKDRINRYGAQTLLRYQHAAAFHGFMVDEAGKPDSGVLLRQSLLHGFHLDCPAKLRKLRRIPSGYRQPGCLIYAQVYRKPIVALLGKAKGTRCLVPMSHVNYAYAGTNPGNHVQQHGARRPKTCGDDRFPAEFINDACDAALRRNGP